MKFVSERWGEVRVSISNYTFGGMAVQLYLSDGEPLATLSVRLAGPAPTPPKFWAKTWSENEEIAEEALASGLFRDTGERMGTGFVIAELWEMVEVPPAPNGTKREI